ncbi:MAG TPA: permease [Bacillota bacterium]|nr:permease [Bacillota bacterium]
MKQFIKRYRFFLGTLIILAAMAFLDRPREVKALNVLYFSLKEMLLVIPPVFLLLGFLDVWVPKETMTRYMGPNSGIKGVILAIFIGSAAAGPLYGAFPVAAVFMKKGVSFTNILVFIGAWSTLKIPMLLFEMASLGPKFTWTRVAVDIPGILIMAWLLGRMITENEKDKLYKQAEKL